jgi:hypothetical protein
MNYYNEHDPKTASWLRELINAGLIPNGDVDERSIVDLQPDELRGYGNAIVPQVAVEFIKAFNSLNF